MLVITYGLETNISTTTALTSCLVISMSLKISEILRFPMLYIPSAGLAGCFME